MTKPDVSATVNEAGEPNALGARVAELIEAAQRKGASAAEVAIASQRSLSVSARAGAREQIDSEDARSADITVYRGQRTASTSTTDLSGDGLAAALGGALEMAAFTEADAYAGLAEADRMAGHWPALSLDHPWALEIDEAQALAVATEAAALAVDDNVERSEGATVVSSRTHHVYGNSHGFVGQETSTHHAITCSAIAARSGVMQRESAMSQARDAADLDEAAAVGRLAGRRAAARLDARPPPATTTAPVLFVPRVARGLWGHLLSAISGGALYRDASFLAGKLDQPFAASALTLTQAPHRPKGLASTGFDAEGVATFDRVLVDAGTLRGYVLGAYTARRLGMESTGNAGGVFNPTIAPGANDFDALVAGMGQGLVVTELMGQGVNLTTGDYSRGAAGFWVDHGEIAYPVENATIAGNLADMYRAIDALGNDVDTGHVLATPSVVVGGMTIAGGY